MRRVLVGVVMVAAVLTGGCGSSSDSAAETCAKARTTLKYYMSDAPEFKALNAEIEKAYHGTGTPDDTNAARLAYNTAFAAALRAVADGAGDPGLKAAVAAAADAYSAGGGDTTALQAVFERCPQKP